MVFDMAANARSSKGLTRLLLCIVLLALTSVSHAREL